MENMPCCLFPLCGTCLTFHLDDNTEHVASEYFLAQDNMHT